MHVTVNRRALRVVEYHADSFEWGYPGSGPATLALSILANYFNERWVNGEYLRRMKFAQAAPKCWHYHQEFKRDLITGLGRGNDDSWEITSDQIAKWLETQPAYEPLDEQQRSKEVEQ
jgi:hypothetical protein